MEYSGKCAIVTGGADGFGKALVEFFVAKGAKVVFGDISVAKGQRLEHELNKSGKNTIFCKCDVTLETDLKVLFQTAYEAFDGAQILINNAGVAPKENFLESTDGIGTIVDINLKAVIMGTSLAVQHFKEQKVKGVKTDNDFCIINISSASAIFPVKEQPVYSATKQGVMFISQTMGYLKEEGIRVNCVLPSFAETQLTQAYSSDPGLTELVDSSGGYISISDVVNSIHQLLNDKTKAGEAFLITVKKKTFLPRAFKSRF